MMTRDWYKFSNKMQHTKKTARGFWKARSHSSLGHFTHALLKLLLKRPHEPKTCAPLMTPCLLLNGAESFPWLYKEEKISCSKVGTLLFNDSKFVFCADQN